MLNAIAPYCAQVKNTQRVAFRAEIGIDQEIAKDIRATLENKELKPEDKVPIIADTLRGDYGALSKALKVQDQGGHEKEIAKDIKVAVERKDLRPDSQMLAITQALREYPTKYKSLHDALKAEYWTM